MRVLLVEDDARAARTLAQMLVEDGYAIEICFDGASAVTRLSRAPPVDALILDYWLPHIDGLAVADYARRRQPSVRIVMVTGHGEVLAQARIGLDPPLIILDKPLDLDAVKNALGRWPA